MSQPTHTFNIGQFRCTVINDGTSTNTAARVFSNVLEIEREGVLAQHGYDHNALEWAYNMLLVQGADHTVLVDTGIGREAVPGAGQLRDTLRALGVEPEDVDTLIITHAHADHIGGLTFFEDQLAFPNARTVMQRSEWEYWGTPEALARMPFERREIYTNTLRWISDRVELFEGEREIVPGITALLAPGHTVGHLALLIESGGARLLHIADAAHHAIQFAQPDWSPSFDWNGDLAAQTRRELFARAADEGLLVAAYHFPMPALGHVHREGDVFRWEMVE